ncbi:MAG: thioredoxin-dependent thiol peroxidase [Thermodesulfobacteriota bacterium]
MVEVGESAPAFRLAGIDGDGKQREFALEDYRGKTVVLYFYPRDNTPGCTREACDFRDNVSRVKKAGAHVLGVSPDSIDAHGKFREKQSLNFPLLSDPERKVAESYGAFGEKKSYGKVTKGIIRSTFIIGPDGRVEKLWRPVKVDGHVDAVLEALKGR